MITVYPYTVGIPHKPAVMCHSNITALTPYAHQLLVKFLGGAKRLCRVVPVYRLAQTALCGDS